MKTELAIIGQGAVTPAGVGIDALLQGDTHETLVPLVSSPERKFPVHRVSLNDPAFTRWQKEPRLRRTSPISYFLVEAAEQALTGLDPEQRARTGLIIAFSTGCLAYSRRLFEGIVTQGQKAASPALFPETVFNSPVSHVAATLRLEGAAYALAGDESAWLAALKTAWLWLKLGRCEQVLVMGAEEFDSASLDAYHSAGWLKNQPPESRFVPSEGAAGLLVRPAQETDDTVISQLEDGYVYRTKSQAQSAAERCLQQFDPEISYLSSADHNWMAGIERLTYQGRTKINVAGKPIMGEAVTASAGWSTLLALSSLDATTSRLLLPIWGTHHQVGGLVLEKRHQATV